MKKIIMTAVIIGIAGLAASPFIIGSKIESVMQEQAQLSDQRLKATAKTNPYFRDASFKLESYEKSFLEGSAHSLLRIETIIPTENDEPLVLEIPMISEITHGPYLGDSGFGLAKIVSRPDISKMELPEAITPDTITIEDIISFTGQIDETMTVLPVKYDDGEGLGIDFAGATAKLKTSTSNRLTFDGDLVFKDVKFSNAETEDSFHLMPIKIDLQGTGDDTSSSGEYQFKSGEIKGESGKGLTIFAEAISANGTYKPAENIELALGEQNMSVLNIEINDPEGLPGPIKIPEFKVKSITEQNDKETINISVNYSAKLDPSLMAIFQSPVDIKTADVAIKINSIPVSVLKDYIELTQNFATPEQAEASMAAMQEQLPSIIQTIINHSSSTFMSVKADTEEGGLEAEVDLSLKSETEFSKEQAMELMIQAGADPSALLAVLSGKGHLHLDKSVTDKAGLTPMVQMMAADFITLEGEAFKSELLVKDGQILVNNQPIPLFTAGPGQDEMLTDEAVAEEATTEEDSVQEAVTESATQEAATTEEAATEASTAVENSTQ